MPDQHRGSSEALRVEGIDVRFGGVRALWGVDLGVQSGAVTGLIGPNGAGKTTLFNVVTGLQVPSRGRVFLDGTDITTARPQRRARLGIGRTFQRLELFGTLTARENVLVAAETRRSSHEGGARAMVDGLLEQVGLTPVADQPADLLPTGLARLLELARALATRPRLLLLDEPSSGLDEQETDQLGQILTELAGGGMAVLLVEHDMRLVMGVCRRVTVLDFGRVIAEGPAAAVRADPLVQAAYLGTAETEGRTGAASSVIGAGAGVATAIPAPAPVAASATPASQVASATPALELVDVRAGYGRIEVVHGVSLSVARGTVTTLLGPNGAGKSTLLRVISGRLPTGGGSVRLDGRDVGGQPPQRRARDGLCTVPEGRPIFPNLTVAENIVMFTFRSRRLRTAALEEQAYARFPVLGERRRQLAGTLSGGEQQMLAIARALLTVPRVLLVDELSMGLAPIVVEQLYDSISAMVRAEGLSVLMVEQFAETALAVADRAAVMVNGRIEVEGTPDEVGDQVVRAYMGVAAG
ncbi:MAG: ATP-binding cassette domain-containing protein [Acidimicrobiales bacterium]